MTTLKPIGQCRMRIVVTGARGLLGATIVHVSLVRGDLDISDDAAVRATIERRPDAIVNCAACDNVDGAEDHPVDALNVNAFAVRGLASAAAAIGAVLVHFSTDFVFDGTGSTPYTEDDSRNPGSVYVASKHARLAGRAREIPIGCPGLTDQVATATGSAGAIEV